MIPVVLVVALQPKGLDLFLEAGDGNQRCLQTDNGGEGSLPGWNPLMIHHTGFLRPVCIFWLNKNVFLFPTFDFPSNNI